MRVALISDLHAVLPALDAVLADIDRVGVDAIVCLGDIVDLGPQPLEVLARLDERGIPCVRGNHDTLDEGPTHPMLAEIEAWTRDQLSAAQLEGLQALPFERRMDLDGRMLQLVHGSPSSVNDQVLDDTPAARLERWWGDRSFDVMACGHTHVQLLRRVHERLVVNVGSVGMPFAEPFRGQQPLLLPWAEYGMIAHSRGGRLAVDLRRIPFDLGELRTVLDDSDFPPGVAWMDQWTRLTP